MIPAGLNLIIVCGGPWPACDWTDDDGRTCILYLGHPDQKAPSGPHSPNRSKPTPKPAHTVDPMAMRA